MKHSLLILFLFAFSTTIFAQSKIQLSGVVRDSQTKELLPGVSIYTNTRPPVGTFSDVEGKFALDLPPGFNDSIIFSYVGYSLQRLKYSESLKEIIIDLHQNSTMLNKIVVNEKPLVAEEFVINKLDYLAIVTNPASSGDPLLAIRSLPSASNQDESASISLRGSDPSQTGVFLNGVPIYDGVKFAQLGGIGTFSIFNAQLIKSTLVFPSNPPLEYGNVGAGLIDMTTESKTEKSYVQGSVGLANSGVSFGAPTGKNGMLTLYSNYQNSALMKWVNQSSFNMVNSFGLKDVGLHFSQKLKGGFVAKIFSYAITEDYSYKFISPSIIGNYLYDKKRILNIVSLEKAYKEVDLSLSAGQSFSKSNASIGSYITNQKNNDLYGSVNVRYYPNDVLTFRVGGTYDNRSITTQGQFPIKTYALSDTSRHYDDTIKISRTLAEAYLYTKVKFNKISASVGVRKNIAIDSVSGYFSFQGNVRYNISRNHFINLSAGRYNTYTTPSPAIFGFIHNTIDQIAIDWSYQTRSSQFDISFYAKNEKFLFPSEKRGAEFHVNHNLLKRLNVDFSFATIHSRTTYDYSNYYYRTFYVPSSYNMPFILKALVKANLKWFNMGAFVLYRSGAPYTPVTGSGFDPYAGFPYPQFSGTPNTGTLPNYFRADVNFSKLVGKQSIDKRWVLYMNINNVFNNFNVRTYAYMGDYSSRLDQYFQKRFLYFGVVKKF